MRTKICAELATGHGGSLETAIKMVDAAAEAGADACKIQHYGAVNPKDPQAAWLNQSRLHIDAIAALRVEAQTRGMEFWVTPFDEGSHDELVDMGGVDRIKIASSEAHNDWWYHTEQPLVVSWPWGKRMIQRDWPEGTIHLCAIPLYPTPLESVGRADHVRDGWSDHTVGLSACLLAICNGAQWLEVHFTLGEGQSRVMAWDKSVADVRRLRQFANDVETMRSGVSQVFRDRWTA